MRRKLFIILAAIIVFGPALSVLYYVSTRWSRPATKYPDFHATWVIASVICGYVGLATALDLVLQVLRTGRRLSHSLWLCGGTAAACVAAVLSLWMLWLTPWRPWLLTVNGLALTGFFFLLYCCRRRFELAVFGMAFAVAGLVLFVIALQEVYTIAGMTVWVKTEGTVTHAGGWQARASKFMTAELAYEYVVNGRRYTGHEDSWKSSCMRHGWGANLRRTEPHYGWNEKAAVYYDPSQPNRAVLMPGLSYSIAFFLRASLLSIFAGMMLLVARAQLRQAKKPVSCMGLAADTTNVGHLLGCWMGRIAFAILSICALLTLTCIRPLQAAALKVVRVDKVPTTADGFCERGLGLLRRRDPHRAFNNFTRGLGLEPNDAALYYDRGHACAQLGHPSQAVADWTKAIQLDWRMAFHVYYDYRSLVPDNVELGDLITRVALDHLGDLEEVSGYAVGAMAETGEFYTASLILSAHLSDEDFLRMAESQNPVVCAMGLIVLARRDPVRYQTTIRSFYNEPMEVPYVPMGCGVSAIPLGTLARNIIEDPNTLQYWDPEKTRWRWQPDRSESPRS
jgi:hypothetical protein